MRTNPGDDWTSLARSILENDVVGQSPVLTLTQFKQLYVRIERLARDSSRRIAPPDILLLTERALIRFPSAPGYVIFVGGQRTPFVAKDFEIVLDAKIIGNKKPITARSFLWTELRRNGIVLLAIGLVFLLLTGLDNDLSTVQLMNQMLIEANALFIAVFVLFTVSQNRDYLARPELFRRGQTHQLMQNDKYMLRVATLSLLLAFGSTALAGATKHGTTPIVLLLGRLAINAQLGARILITVALILLVDCFLSVANYYLRLATTAVESKGVDEWILESEVDDKKDNRKATET
jgi:hypothetical protein